MPMDLRAEDSADLQLLHTQYPSYQEALELIGTDKADCRGKARQILTDILTELEANSRQNSLWIAAIRSGIGCVLIDSGETNDGERVLAECIAVLEQDPQRVCLQLILSLNSLAIIKFQRGDVDTSRMYLEKAEHIFHESAPEGQPDHYRKQLVRHNTQTVFLLAQVYSQSTASDKAALYCHKTLQRQIIDRQSSSDFDAFDWAMNCIRLSAFYINNKRLRQAKYCIDVASEVLPEGQSEPHIFAKADIDCALAEIYGRWLQWSASQYQQNRSGLLEEDSQLDNTIDEFASVDVQVLDCFSLAQNLKDAQTIFREGFAHFQAALGVYTLDGFVTDYVGLVQRCSALLKDLAIFSCDHSYICKLYKRRIDLLEPVVQKLNPKIYSEFTRQLLHEIAQVYSDMADHKTEQNSPTPAQDKLRSKKINSLMYKSIQYFNQFVESLRDNGSIKSDYTHEFLKAKFQVARLHSRFVHSDVELQVAALRSSLHEYEHVKEFCRNRPVSEFSEELHICQEMCSLLPLKIQSLIRSAKQ